MSDLIEVTAGERTQLIDAVMVLMKGMESVPGNDLSEMPGLQRLLNKLMGHDPGLFPYRPPAMMSG